MTHRLALVAALSTAFLHADNTVAWQSLGSRDPVADPQGYAIVLRALAAAALEPEATQLAQAAGQPVASPAGVERAELLWLDAAAPLQPALAERLAEAGWTTQAWDFTQPGSQTRAAVDAWVGASLTSEYAFTPDGATPTRALLASLSHTVLPWSGAMAGATQQVGWFRPSHDRHTAAHFLQTVGTFDFYADAHIRAVALPLGEAGAYELVCVMATRPWPAYYLDPKSEVNVPWSPVPGGEAPGPLGSLVLFDPSIISQEYDESTGQYREVLGAWRPKTAAELALETNLVDIADYVSADAAARFTALRSQMQPQPIAVAFPVIRDLRLFSVSFSPVDLTETGLTLMDAGGSQLGNFSTERIFSLEQFGQESRVQCDAAGWNQVSLTSATLQKADPATPSSPLEIATCGPLPRMPLPGPCYPVLPSDFRADHPFYYQLRERASGLVLAQGLVGHVATDAAAEAALDGRIAWQDTGWLGWIFTPRQPWLYHTKLGWIFTEQLAAAGTWFYAADRGWCFSSAAAPRWIYDSTCGWIFDGPGAWWYDPAAGAWFVSAGE